MKTKKSIMFILVISFVLSSIIVIDADITKSKIVKDFDVKKYTYSFNNSNEKIPDGGLCQGMSLVPIFSYIKKVPVKQTIDNNNLSLLGYWDKYYTDKINNNKKYNISIVNSVVTQNSFLTDNHIAIMKNMIESNYPFALGFGNKYVDFDKKIRYSGHVVVVYGYEQKNDMELELKVYDSNFPLGKKSGDRRVYLSKGSTGKWNYLYNLQNLKNFDKAYSSYKPSYEGKNIMNRDINIFRTDIFLKDNKIGEDLRITKK